jgi:rubredoxin
MASQVQCPKCKNFKTEPYGTPFMDSFIDAWGITQESFENKKYIRKFNAGEIRAKCNFCGLIFDAKTTWDSEGHPTTNPPTAKQKTSEERLAELEELKKKRFISEEEYKRKREEILRSL